MKQSAPIYLDYAAATPLSERAYQCMKPYAVERFFNPSASYQAAEAVRADLEQARKTVAVVLGVKSTEVIFCAGASESISLALRGVLDAHEHATMVTTQIEHAAVLSLAQDYEVKQVAVDHKGHVLLDQLESAISDTTAVISIGYVNNEIGTMQPLARVAALVAQIRRDRDNRKVTMPLYLHSDASQAVGYSAINPNRLGLDLMTLNGGKCYGPKQSGILFVKSDVPLRPLVYGGGQESGLRGGSENVAAAVGFAVALEETQTARADLTASAQQLRTMICKYVSQTMTGVTINNPRRALPHIINLSIEGIDGERLLMQLDYAGVMVATGSACAANSHSQSHVLRAIGLDDKQIAGSIRLSLGRQTTVDEITRALSVLDDCVTQQRKMS